MRRAGHSQQTGFEVANSHMIVLILLTSIAALIAAYAFTLWSDTDRSPDA